MNEKVKKAFATGTAALMAASAVPSQAATEANSNKHIKKNAVLDTIKSHPYHSVTTASLGISTVTMLAVSLILNSKLQAAKSKTNAINKDTLSLKEAEELLKGMTNGNILLDYLLLLTKDKKSTTMLTLTASQDEDGRKPGKGDTIEKTYVKVEAGDGAGNLCAKQGILEHSAGAVVGLTNLAVYLVYCSGTPKEPDKQNLLLQPNTQVEQPNTDKKLTGYTTEILTPHGKFLARLTANVIMSTLEESKEEPKEEEKHTNEHENGGTKDDTADSDETKKVKLELLQRILGFDFKKTEFKSVLKFKLYSDQEYATPTTKNETALITDAYIQFLEGTTQETGTTKQLLDDIFTWRGQTRQVLMHMFAYLKGDDAKNKESGAPGFTTVEDPTKKIAGYTDKMFDATTLGEINSLQEALAAGYEKGTNEQAEDGPKDA